MTVKELYEEINASYDNVFSRIPSEGLIIKFLKKFENDETFNSLQENISKKDYKEAFRSVHTLKGICLNMSFDNLLKYVLELTEVLRNEDNVDESKVIELNENIKEQYNITINSIQKLN